MTMSEGELRRLIEAIEHAVDSRLQHRTPTPAATQTAEALDRLVEHVDSGRMELTVREAVRDEMRQALPREHAEDHEHVKRSRRLCDRFRATAWGAGQAVVIAALLGALGWAVTVLWPALVRLPGQ